MKMEKTLNVMVPGSLITAVGMLLYFMVVSL